MKKSYRTTDSVFGGNLVTELRGLSPHLRVVARLSERFGELRVQRRQLAERRRLEIAIAELRQRGDEVSGDWRAHDTRGALAVGGQNNDPRPPHVLLRTVAIPDDRP